MAKNVAMAMPVSQNRNFRFAELMGFLISGPGIKRNLKM
jgi:hypothetical protein